MDKQKWFEKLRTRKDANYIDFLESEIEALVDEKIKRDYYAEQLIIRIEELSTDNQALRLENEKLKVKENK